MVEVLVVELIIVKIKARNINQRIGVSFLLSTSYKLFKVIAEYLPGSIG